MKKTASVIVVLLTVLLAGIGGRYLLLGGAKPESLSSDPISWAVEQSLQSGATYQPIEGKDYTISNVKYFESGQWAVVSTTPIGTFSDSELIVFKKDGSGSYQVKLGPGNSFVGANLSSLPSDVAKYLHP